MGVVTCEKSSISKKISLYFASTAAADTLCGNHKNGRDLIGKAVLGKTPTDSTKGPQCGREI